MKKNVIAILIAIISLFVPAISRAQVIHTALTQDVYNAMITGIGWDWTTTQIDVSTRGLTASSPNNNATTTFTPWLSSQSWDINSTFDQTSLTSVGTPLSGSQRSITLSLTESEPVTIVILRAASTNDASTLISDISLNGVSTPGTEILGTNGEFMAMEFSLDGGMIITNVDYTLTFNQGQENPDSYAGVGEYAEVSGVTSVPEPSPGLIGVATVLVMIGVKILTNRRQRTK